MIIFRNLIFIFLMISLFVQISFSSEIDCIKEESYNKGYKAALYDISKGNWKYTILSVPRDMLEHQSIKKKAEEYGLSIGRQDDFIDKNEYCYMEGYNKAVGDKLKEKYGVDVIQKIIENPLSSRL